MERIVLSVAGLSLEVVGPEPLLNPLRADFHGGETNGSRPWTVSVHLDDSLPDSSVPLYGVEPRCSGGECLLEAEGYSGWIDAGAGRASLKAHRYAVVEDVQYFLRVVLAVRAFAQGGVLFHAAGVSWGEGAGVAFFGRSGSGKTTVASFADDAGLSVLHDDLLILRPGDDGWRMWGVPFGRRVRPGRGVPLTAMFLLVQDMVDAVAPLSRSRALGELVSNSPVVSADAGWLPALLDRWEGVMDVVPCRTLRFRLGDGFIDAVSEWMDLSPGGRRL